MQTNHNSDTITVKITPNDRGNPAGKLADAELHFGGESLARRPEADRLWVPTRGITGKSGANPARSRHCE